MTTKTVTKPEKVALCRECHGTGKVIPADAPTRSLSKLGFSKRCPNCEGSGRVLVSCEMTLHLRPYRNQEPR